MWNYEKRLQYPVNIKNTCPRTASLILSQFGGPDGELSASCGIWPRDIPCPVRKWAAS